MNPEDALLQLFSGHGLTWQTAPTTYRTKKGKEKICAQAFIDGKTFWRHYRSETGDLRALLRLAGAWFFRPQKKQWSLLIAIKPRNVALLSDRIGLVIVHPALTASQSLESAPF